MGPALLALLLALGEPVIAVVPIPGPLSDACARELAVLLGTRAELFDTKAELEEEAKEDPTLKKALLIMTRPGKLRLEAIEVATQARLGLRVIDVSAGCRFSPAKQAMLRSFLAASFEGGAQETHTSSAARAIEGTATSSIAALTTTSSTSTTTAEVPRRRARKARPEVPASSWSIGASLDLFSREFAFSGEGTPNLSGYHLDLSPMPEVTAELKPFLGNPGFIRGLIIAGFFRHSLGLESHAQEGGPRYPTTFSDAGVEVGLRFLPPTTGSSLLRLALVPAIGVRTTRFTLDPATDGTKNANYPDLSYVSPLVKITLEVPLKAGFGLIASASYLLIQSAGAELSSAAFFPAHVGGEGLEVQGALEVSIIPGLAARIGGEYLRYNLSFKNNPTDVRLAVGAQDSYIVLSAGVVVRSTLF